MAKNFGSAGSAKTIKAVAQASNEKANVITVKMVSDENLFDYAKNNEDITDTTDLENSMKELGFTDPIEATGYGMEEGKYTIVSGHRRRMAGRNVGIKTFPVIVKTFKSDEEIRNYVLLANSQRDSAKDPLLFCKRYKMHEEYLKEANFKGSVREEIAKRLGISTQQADRYNQMNKVILPVWDMIRDEKVGMSSVLPMATLTEVEQEEVLTIFKEALDNKQSLTRDLCSKLIKGYKEGKKSYLEIIQIEMSEVMNPPVMPMSSQYIVDNGEGGSRESDNPFPRNNETNYDYSHREGLESGKDPYADERLTPEDYAVINGSGNGEPTAENGEPKEKEKKPPLTEEEKKILNGEKISQNLGKIESLLNDFYEFEDKDKAEAVMKTMGSVIKLMVAEMDTISDDYECADSFKKTIKDVVSDMSEYTEE